MFGITESGSRRPSQTEARGRGLQPTYARSGRDALVVTVIVRASLPADGDDLREIERLAGARFREIGMADIADNEPTAAEVLARYADSGRSWVAIAEDGHLAGYILVDVVDGNAHIDQVSVRPDYQGIGIGRALLNRVSQWARHQGSQAVTLTTFSEVPWNQPLYEHLGFVVIRGDEIGPELGALCWTEADHGLDPGLRVCMRLRLSMD
ncbi:MAG: GNAT family N-acetyltransferase [Acidimicrobiales bacterium]